MAFNTITNKTFIPAAHIEDVIGIDDTSDTSGPGSTPVTKKVNLEQIRDYVNVGHGIPLQNFQAKLARVKKGSLSKVRIFCVGDSTTVGKGAGTDAWGNSWPAVLTQLFKKAGFNATTAAFYNNGDGTNASTYNTARLVAGSSWSTSGLPSLGGNAFTATTTTNALAFTPTDYWDTAYVYYPKAAFAGTFSIDIDGAGTTSINANGSNANANTTITTAIPGIHTLNFKYVSGTQAIGFGAECYNSTLSQVMIVNCGWGGVTTAGIAAGTNPYDPIGAFQYAAPDLTIFGTVINDWLQSVNTTTLATKAQALITAAKISGDCIWMLSVPSAISNTALATQQAYCKIIRDVCLANNVPVIDIFDRFQSYEISQPLSLYSDTIHENAAGYEIVADSIFKMLNVKGESPNIAGIIDGSNAAASVVGEYGTSSVAIGSAISLTTATDKTITSITLQPGDYDLWGNVGFIAAAGTIPTVLTGSINTTTNVQATSPNGGAFVQLSATLGTGTTSVLPVGAMRVNPTVATTYYLVGTATFSVSTLTAYGSITARRRR